MNLNQRLHDPAFDKYSRRDNKTTKPSDSGFYDLGIAPNFVKVINRLKYKTPTPIQKGSIPVGIDGKDIIAIAQTGSGKTVAFGIPMLQRLSKIKNGSGLVLVPTRELAIQVEESLQPFCQSINFRSAVIIGGASMSTQRIALKKNPRIIIATPGRLMDHIERRTVKLGNIEVFILDEADRMLDMGFVPDIRKIIKSIPDNRQTMLFSATMPKEIEAIAKTLMDNPTRIEIDRSGATPAKVSHEMFVLKNQDKSRLLALQLKQCTGPVLVFTKTKRMASKLTIKVKDMGFASAEIHSNRSLGQRKKALEGFKRGIYQVLVATDIAARGIDVTGIELVVNYDMPANSEDYVHRIGRTGRAGKTGRAVSFATSAQKGSIKHIERFMKTKLAISTLPTLPSEKLLIKEAEHLNLNYELDKDQRPSNRNFPKSRPPRRSGFKKRDPRKFTAKQKDSRQDNFRKKSNHQDSRPQYSKPKVSKPQDSNPQDSNPQKMHLSDIIQNETTNENSYWSRFKKKRPTKKKSSDRKSRRKKRT